MGKIMSFKKKIENMILSRSNSYNFYKNQYEKYIAGDIEDISKIEKEFKQLKKEFEEFKNQTNDHMDSTTYLLKNVYVDHELNEPRNVLGYVQTLSKELLVLISRICRENDLEFWLDYGSLLGAVRHESFVPWDDDTDIGMMRANYNKFKDIISDEIEKIDLDDILKVEKEPNSFIKILVKNENGGDISCLNVYPYDYLTKYSKKSTPKKYNKCKKSLNIENDFEKYYDELHLSLDAGDYIIPCIDGACGKNDYYKFFVLKSDKVFPLNEISFSEVQFNSPNDSRYYLKKVYGDYLNIPRIIPRHDTVDSYRYNADNDEVFGQCIQRIREVK